MLDCHKHLCWLRYIQTSKNMNKHEQTQTQKTHIDTYSGQLTNKHTYINTCIDTSINIYKHGHTQIHTYTHIHYTFRYIYIYIYIHARIYTHIHTCIHMHIYTYTHVHIYI